MQRLARPGWAFNGRGGLRSGVAPRASLVGLLLLQGACGAAPAPRGSLVQVPEVVGEPSGPPLPERGSDTSLSAADCLVPEYRARFRERWELSAVSELYLSPVTSGSRVDAVRKRPSLAASPEFRLVDRDGTLVRLLTESMGILYLVYVPAADVRRYRPPGADEGETIYLPSIQTVSGLVQVDLAAGTYLHAGPGEREPVGVALRAVRVRAPRPRDEQLERTKIAAPIDPWGYVDLWVDSARLSPSGD